MLQCYVLLELWSPFLNHKKNKDVETTQFNLELEKGEKVELRGFGSFVVKKRKAREARNPATNEVVNLKDRYIPSFKVSKILKKKIN